MDEKILKALKEQTELLRGLREDYAVDARKMLARITEAVVTK